MSATEKGTRGARLLSHTEISTAQTCFAQWDFKYGGRLAGSALQARELVPLLSNGRAWGAGVAAWHAHASHFSLLQEYEETEARWLAQQAVRDSIALDAADSIDRGAFPNVEREIDRALFVGECLDHYMATAEKLPGLTRLEGEMLVPIPSRNSNRASTRYRFHGFIDGYNESAAVPVEFKFRTKLLDPDLIRRSRQPRYYAWAWQQLAEVPIDALIYDERLAVVPKPARIVHGRKKGTFTVSHARDQLCTAEAYQAACAEFDIDPHDDTVAALEARQWQQRIEIIFRPGELEEAGRELVSAGVLIQQLDSGAIYPLRNAKASTCNACDFRSICSNPRDDLYVDMLFERDVPKRQRPAVDPKAAVGPSPAPRAVVS
jgi:PD-(D/E)XK nuclease superfamily protein